jgi:hypothetical protein
MTTRIVAGALCVLAVGVAAPVLAADTGNPPGAESADAPGRGSRDTLAPKQAPDATETAQKPLPQGRNTEPTKPAETQVGADPQKSKADRDPAAQSQAQPVETQPPAADAHAEGARGPRGDDESRARAGLPEYEGPVQKPGATADPNLKQDQAR